ncbi:MAG: hypothetical protein WCA46_23810 [Actinocatenispora sp.]
MPGPRVRRSRRARWLGIIPVGLVLIAAAAFVYIAKTPDSLFDPKLTPISIGQAVTMYRQHPGRLHPDITLPKSRNPPRAGSPGRARSAVPSRPTEPPEPMHSAEAKDDVARAVVPPVPVWAGEAVDLVTDLPPAAELVAALAEQAENALAWAGVLTIAGRPYAAPDQCVGAALQ